MNLIYAIVASALVGAVIGLIVCVMLFVTWILHEFDELERLEKNADEAVKRRIKQMTDYIIVDDSED